MALVESSKLATSDFKPLKINGMVGFVSLPEQLVAKVIHNGFSFNILCVGETGLGKSTLMETLFNQKFDFTPSPHDLAEVKLRSQTHELKEKNVKLRLTIVETCGYADQINKDNSAKAILDYLDTQFEAYLQEEMKIKRDLPDYHDTRIHACLYFIGPTGHSLKAIDLVTMQKLQHKVNLIPIIAKSDTITKAELLEYKSRILNELNSNNVQFYKFPSTHDEIKDLNESMNALLPFAIVGATEELTGAGGKTVRGRSYPWGVVEVDNAAHCDFVKLREMLIRVNMEDLRESTHTVHYERYRQMRLAQMGFRDDDLSLQEIYEKQRESQRLLHQRKEDEMRQLFVAKVKEKEEELKEADRKLNQQFETVKKQHAEERKRYEDRKRQLEDEMNLFEKRRQSYEHSSKASGLATLGKKKK